MSNRVEMDVIPKCDICQTRKAKYDAKTVQGPWAYMCQSDWLAYGGTGGKLGTGYGQELVEREV